MDSDHSDTEQKQSKKERAMKSWVQQLAEELVRLEENDSVKASITKAKAEAEGEEAEGEEETEEEGNTQ